MALCPALHAQQLARLYMSCREELLPEIHYLHKKQPRPRGTTITVASRYAYPREVSPPSLRDRHSRHLRMLRFVMQPEHQCTTLHRLGNTDKLPQGTGSTLPK